MPIYDQKTRLTKYKKEEVSSKLIYEAWTDKLDALDSDPYWLLQRTTKNGKSTTVEYANNGKGAIWTERASLFPPASFNNEFSVSLDGIGDRVEFGNEFNFNSTNQWSFSIWFKADNLSAQRCLYAKATADTAVLGYGFYLRSDGKIFMQLRSSTGKPNFFTSQAFLANQWNNLTVTFSGNSNQNGARLYLNGQVDTTPPSVSLGSLLSNQTAMIGSRNGSFNFVGKLDEFSVWDKELSAAEVSESYNDGVATELESHSSSNNLVHYYRLGDGDSGTTVLDNAGSVNGALIGEAAFVEDAP